MRTTFNWSIWITCFLFFLWTGLAIASPPPLPIAGDLTDQEGKPLNETVTLTFYLTESETSDQVLWSEKHDNVTVKQGRFAVLLGEKKDLLKDDESPIDFTQKKYIKVEIKRDGKESYTLSPPLIYMPTLGSWQSVHADKAKHAVQADNAAKLDGHGWDEVIKINNLTHSTNSELQQLKATINSNFESINQKILSLEQYKSNYPNPLQIVESGTVSYDRGNNGRVNFNQTFKTAPIVMIGINNLDIDGRPNARLNVSVIKIDNRGFDYAFGTWADTIIYSASANWIAVGQ